MATPHKYCQLYIYFLQSSFLLVDNFVWAGSLLKTIYILDSDTSTGVCVCACAHGLCACIYVNSEIAFCSGL